MVRQLGQIPEFARKSPVQTRAQHTVETLLDTAAQVLEQEGERGFTTNRVAAAAGFSIGTLYQYFPNKTAMLAALASRERRRVEATLAKALADSDAADAEAVIRIIVRTCLAALGRRHRARRILTVQVLRFDLAPGLMRGLMDGLGQTMAEAIAARGGAVLSSTEIFVLAHAITGTIRAAIVQEHAALGSPAFEDALVRLGARFVAATR